MLEAKCRFIGSATLAENIDTVAVPPNMTPILGETRDPYLRETLRDIGCAQSFRRDLFRKGIAPLPAAEQQNLVEGMTLAGLGQPVPEGGVTFATPIGSVTGRPEVYEPLLSMINSGSLSVRQATPVGCIRRPAPGGADAGVYAAGRRRLRTPDAAGWRHRGRA